MKMFTFSRSAENGLCLTTEAFSDTNRFGDGGRGIVRGASGVAIDVDLAVVPCFAVHIVSVTIVVPFHSGGGVRWASSGDKGWVLYFVSASPVTPRLSSIAKGGEGG